MGDSLHPLGPRLGQWHAWRERGGLYVDGLRTSAQAAILTAGVAKGADFTGTAWAVGLGLALFVTIESAKIAAGWLDARFDIWRSHTQAVAEQNPIVMRQLEALERLSPISGRPDEDFTVPVIPYSRPCKCSVQFTKHQTGCVQRLDGQPLSMVNALLTQKRLAHR